MENYLLTIPASKVVLVNDQMIGKQIVDVKGTPFDFVNTSNLLESIQKIESTGIKARGIDHYFVFDTSSGKNKITLESLSSKRKLSLITTYPGVTIYTANYPTLKSINNHQILVKHGAICLEAQYQSNAINDERFSLGFVTPDSPYHHEIEYLLEE
jgi:aldose 1-epimerase